MLDDDSHQYNYLVCFLMVDKSGIKIVQDFYTIDESSISDYHKYDFTEIKLDNVKMIKSITIKDIKKALVIVFIESGDMYAVKIYRYYYEYSDTHLDMFYEPQFKCSKKNYGIKTSYIYEKDILSFSCLGSGAAVRSVLVENSLGNVKVYNQFQPCELIYGHSVIFSNYFHEYYVISDVICNNHQRTFIHLIGDIPEYKEENEEEEQFEEEKIENDSFEEEEKFELNEKERESFEFYEEIFIEKEMFKELIEELYEENEERFNEVIEEEKEKEMKLENEEEKTELIIGDCSELEKCSQCNQESISKNLCIKCNNEKGYYLLKTNYYSSDNIFIECINETSKPSNFYFDQENKDFEPCFETCAECFYKGSLEDNNCSLCDSVNYIKKPEYENSNNCVTKCKYLYYYNDYNQYKCTNYPFCPDDYNFLIKNKNKCTNNCTKDDTYKFYYNRECFNQCPNGTKDDEDYICKDEVLNRCFLSENDFISLNENITDDDIEKLVKIYAEDFGYIDTHVSIYKNDIYTVTIYKDSDCISDLSLETPEIVFGECEIKVKQNYNLSENLIVAIMDKNIEGLNQRKIISYGLYSPISGIKLPSDEICQDDKLMFLENLSFKLQKSNVDISTFTQLYSQGIDLFNLSSPFYTDVCFQYNSIDNDKYSNKDIALKDRVLVYFPNISLCEDGCDIKGINITSFKAICECSYSSSNKDLLKDNALYQSQVGELEELISSINIYVMKCYKNMINKIYFKECFGGLIILILLIIEIICTIIYYLKGFFSIKVYIFDIATKFINYISPKKDNKHSLKNQTRLLTGKGKESIKIIDYDKNNDNINNNDKQTDNIFEQKEKQNNKYNYNKKQKSIIISKPTLKSKRLILRRHLYYMNNNGKINENYNNFELNSNESTDNNKNIIILHHENIKENLQQENDIHIYSNYKILEKQEQIDKEILYKDKDIDKISYESFSNSKTDLKLNIRRDEFFEEYLQTEFADMEFDDLLEKDKRHFCEYFKEKIIENQIIVNTFCCDEPFKPRSIKILLLVLQIDLYFLINGLFYDEEYASEIFHLEEDSFSDILGRFFGNLVYAALVGIIISYIIEWFFIEESRLKKIFKKRKKNIDILKYEINQMVKDIKRRYIIFIIITFLITIFTWIHISCFNIVYPHLKWEWFLFSVIIIIFMQMLSVLLCFLQASLRFISFKCKSEKIYKISYLIS